MHQEQKWEAEAAAANEIPLGAEIYGIGMVGQDARGQMAWNNEEVGMNMGVRMDMDEDEQAVALDGAWAVITMEAEDELMAEELNEFEAYEEACHATAPEEPGLEDDDVTVPGLVAGFGNFGECLGNDYSHSRLAG
jgi:hypothetical protein